MSIHTAYSTKPLADAVAEIQRKLEQTHPRVVLYFASPVYNPDLVAREMQGSFPGSTVVGCSTPGEIGEGKMLAGSIAAWHWTATLSLQRA